MRSLKISVPGLFWLLVLFVALTVSLQAQAGSCFCREVGPPSDDPEMNFRKSDVVATVRFLGFNESGISKYEIIKLWKSPEGLIPGTIIRVYEDNGKCGCCDEFQKKGITIAYLSYGALRDDIKFLLTDRCIRSIHESENGYTERIHWLDARVKQISR